VPNDAEDTAPVPEATDMAALKLDPDEVRAITPAPAPVSVAAPASASASETESARRRNAGQAQTGELRAEEARAGEVRVEEIARAMPVQADPAENDIAEAMEHSLAGVIEGRVVDASTGKALAGVVVADETSGAVAITDRDGLFALSTESESAKLVAQSLGYQSVDVEAGADKEVLITMVEDPSSYLDEVVVTGYGAQRRSTLTGSVSAPVTPAEPVEPAEPLRDTVVTAEFGRWLDRQRPLHKSLGAGKGAVTLSFEVSEDGRPENIKIAGAASPAAGRALRRLLREGPDWPAQHVHKLITINL
jgi:hypothetical protein